MWKKFVKDYLSFTNKDRIGVIVLVTLIFIVVLLPYMWPAKKVVRLSGEEIEKIKLQTAQLNRTNAANTTAEQEEDEPVPGNYPTKKNYTREKAEIFYFDPNTLDAEGWKRLGIRDNTALTIQKYLSRGGKFRKPEDIGKIYGLFKDDYERLLPYVQIKSETGFEHKNNESKKEYPVTDKPVYPGKHFSSPEIIEINIADTTAFIALPGIGSKLAARIVNFRDKLGGFYSVQQVAETYGLPDTAFDKIKVFLQCNNPSVQQLNINTTDANTLKQHPYIRWNLANVIVQYRVQHGNFKSVDDLLQIAIITPEIFAKISPYLSTQ
jgi:DNA uptake protein ComE-like DNA-binding protein